MNKRSKLPKKHCSLFGCFFKKKYGGYCSGNQVSYHFIFANEYKKNVIDIFQYLVLFNWGSEYALPTKRYITITVVCFKIVIMYLCLLQARRYIYI